MTTPFDFSSAFNRNIGWITELEQQQLRTKRIGIAGLGGVGGYYALSLARMGISNFNLADLDHFELQNFNRQVGANLHTINQPKINVMNDMVKNINPDADIRLFPMGLTKENIDDFLKDIDLYIDGLDFFELPLRRQVFQRCAELKIPAITAAPIGMGTCYLVFMPDQMTFEEYFHFDQNATPEENLIKFLIGVNPQSSAKNLVEPTATNFSEKKGPSTVMACELCAGVACVSAIKILLNRGKIYPAPYYHYFNPYENKFICKRLMNGNRHLLQRLKYFFVKRKLNKKYIQKPHFAKATSQLEEILDLARFAPSVENMQPWEFEVIDNDNLVIHMKDHEGSEMYDYGAIPSMMTLGIMIESLIIAASQFQLRCEWRYLKIAEHDHAVTVHFSKDMSLSPSDLIPFLKLRSVDRTPYQKYGLPKKQKELLQCAAGERFDLIWLEEEDQKKKFAKMNASAMTLRLKSKEAFDLQTKTIEWNKPFSEDKIPAQTLGFGRIRRKLMQWVTQYRRLSYFLNHGMGAANIVAYEISYRTGVACAAHVLLRAHDDNASTCIAAGQAMQRIWLTATKLGLVMQPEFSALSYAYYAEHENKLEEHDLQQAKKIAGTLRETARKSYILFNGRIGYPLKPQNSLTSRSIRKPLANLLRTK